MQRIRMGYRQRGQDLRRLPMHVAPDTMGGLYCPLAIRQFPRQDDNLDAACEKRYVLRRHLSGNLLPP